MYPDIKMSQISQTRFVRNVYDSENKLFCWKSRIREILNLSACAVSSTNTPPPKKKKEEEIQLKQKKIYIYKKKYMWPLTCHLSHITCHLPSVTFDVSCVTCHLSLTQTATAIHPYTRGLYTLVHPRCDRQVHIQTHTLTSRLNQPRGLKNPFLMQFWAHFWKNMLVKF